MSNSTSFHHPAFGIRYSTISSLSMFSFMYIARCASHPVVPLVVINNIPVSPIYIYPVILPRPTLSSPYPHIHRTPLFRCFNISIYPSLHPSTRPSIRLPVCPFICSFVHSSTRGLHRHCFISMLIGSSVTDARRTAYMVFTVYTVYTGFWFSGFYGLVVL